MKTTIVALLLVIGLTAHASEDDLDPHSIDSIEKYLSEHAELTTIEAFVRALPEEFRTHYVLITKSRSAQPASASQPRVILQNTDASALFGFSTKRDEEGEYSNDLIEMIAFNKSEKKYEFHSIDFAGDSPVINRNPTSCLGCHGEKPRPNWDTYDYWPGMLPFNKDKIYAASTEEKMWRKIFSNLSDDPRFHELPLPQGMEWAKDGTSKVKELKISYNFNEPVVDFKLPDGTMVKRGGESFLVKHEKKTGEEGRGTGLFDFSTQLNAVKVAKEVETSPRFAQFKFALAAVLSSCQFNDEALQRFFPKTVLEQKKAFFQGLTLKQLEEKTLDVRKDFHSKKEELSKQYLKEMILDLAEGEGVTYTPEELERKILTEIVRRPQKGGGVFITDVEAYGDTGLIAKLRYILEPDSVSMSKWSLSDRSNSETFTFGDLFGTYSGRLQVLASANVPQGSTCDSLAEESMNAYKDREMVGIYRELRSPLFYLSPFALR